jgi:predicted nucleic acid-binding protein
MDKALADKVTASSRVYVDTNIFVYFIESSPKFFPQVKIFFERVDAVGAQLVTNEITLAECIYKPCQDADAKLVQTYETLFENSGEIELFPLDGELAKQAAVHGSQIGLKLVDAIHYVSAL